MNNEEEYILLYLTPIEIIKITLLLTLAFLYIPIWYVKLKRKAR